MAIYDIITKSNDGSESKYELKKRSAVSSEELDAIKHGLDDYFDTHHIFKGKYSCKICDGKVSFPWKRELAEPLMWSIISLTENKEEKARLVVFYKDCFLDKDATVLEQGVCEITEKGDLLIPPTAIKLFDGDGCVWLGNLCYGELMSEKDYDALVNGQEITDAIERLKSLDNSFFGL